jgi:hypothetical protein
MVGGYSSADSTRHLPALDGLRAIAILLVIPHNTYVFADMRGWLTPFAWIANAPWAGASLYAHGCPRSMLVHTVSGAIWGPHCRVSSCSKREISYCGRSLAAVTG